jgi:Glycosyl hydrolase family 26
MAGAPRRSRLRVLGVSGVVIVAFLLAACSGSSPTQSQPPAPSPSTPTKTTGHCALNDQAVPSCGVLWGIATHPPTLKRLDQAQQAIGRQVDFVYRYHDINDLVPDDAERRVVAQGKLLHIAIAARDFSNSVRGDITWAQVASGQFDSTLSAQAKGVASLEVPVFMTFEQEASQKHKLAALGTPDDFKAAWRHLHDLYVQAGATNAVWTWVMTGSDDNLQNAAQLWPGNQYVDWISWNVYNQSGCKGNKIALDKFVSFKDKMLIFYTWMKAEGPKIGMDTSKPIMISETGSAQYQGDLQATADWYAAIPDALKEYPQIKAIGLWDSTDSYCNYDFTDIPAIASGVREASLDPYLDLRGALKHAG